MAVFNWDDAENARFLNKHVVIVGNNASLGAMLTLGTEIFQRRVRAGGRSKSAVVQGLKSQYGGGFNASLANTLVLMTPIAKEQLASAIEAAACANKQYELKTGLFFQSYNDRTEVGMTAKLGLKFLAKQGGGGKYLEHLNTSNEPNPTVIETKLADTTDKAFVAQQIVSHSSTPDATRLAPQAPSVAQLMEAKSRLKHIPTSMVRDIGWHDLGVDENDGIPAGFFD